MYDQMSAYDMLLALQARNKGPQSSNAPFQAGMANQMASGRSPVNYIPPEYVPLTQQEEAAPPGLPISQDAVQGISNLLRPSLSDRLQSEAAANPMLAPMEKVKVSASKKLLTPFENRPLGGLPEFIATNPEGALMTAGMGSLPSVAVQDPKQALIMTLLGARAPGHLGGK